MELAAPTVACSGAQTPAAPTNGIAGAAGVTSRPYKWGLICRGGSITSRPYPTNGPVFIAPIYRGGSITSRPYKCPPYKTDATPSSSSGHSLQPVKKKVGGLGHLPKIALLRGEGFGLKSFGGEVVECKKMLFHNFFEVLMVG